MDEVRLDAGGHPTRVAWKGDGRTAVLLHGAGQDGRVWDDALAAVPPGWRFVAPDLPGHGRDPAGPPCTSYAALSAWLAALAGALELGAPVVVGHSFASCLALHHALGRQPCGGVVVVNGTAAARGAWSDAKLVLIGVDPVAWFLVHLRAVCGTAAEPARVDRIVAEARRTMRADLLMTDLRLFLEADLRGALAACPVPLRVIHGLDDWSLPPDLGRAIAEAAGGEFASGFEGIPGAGHFPHQERPALFSAALARALAALPA